MFINPMVKVFFCSAFVLNITFSLVSTTLVFSNPQEENVINVQPIMEESEQQLTKKESDKKLSRVRRKPPPNGRSPTRGSASRGSSPSRGAAASGTSHARDASPEGRRKTSNAENTPPSSPGKWTEVARKSRKRTSPNKNQSSPPKQQRVQKPLFKEDLNLPLLQAPSVVEQGKRRDAREKLKETYSSETFTNSDLPEKGFQLQWNTKGEPGTGMEHILRHHAREYHDGSGAGKPKHSMFPEKTTHTGVRDMIKEAIANPALDGKGKPLVQQLDLNFFQFKGTAKNGIPLVVGYRKAKGIGEPADIMQAFPVGKKYEVKITSAPSRRRRGILADEATGMLENAVDIYLGQGKQKIMDSPYFQEDVRKNAIYNRTLRALSLEFSNEENQTGAITISWENPSFDLFESKPFYLFKFLRSPLQQDDDPKILRLYPPKDNEPTFKGLQPSQTNDGEPIFKDQPQKNRITSYLIGYEDDPDWKDSAVANVGAEKITNLQATILSNDKIRLDWDSFDPKKELNWDPVEIKWTIIFRNSEIIDIVGNTNSFEDNEVEPNQVYIYRVIAFVQEPEPWKNQQHAIFYSKPLIVSTEQKEDIGQDTFVFHTYLLEQVPMDLNDFKEQPEKYYTYIKNKASNGIVQKSIVTWDDEPVEMLNGLIDVEINGRSLVNPACFDNVRMLWDYLLAMVKEYLETSQATIYFPDQPIPFSLVKEREGIIEFQVDDQRVTIDEQKCLTAILQGAERFFTLLNEVSVGRYSLLLGQISNMQNQVNSLTPKPQPVIRTTLSAQAERISLNRVLLSWDPSNKEVKSYKILLDDQAVIALPAYKTSYTHIFQPKEQTGTFSYKLVAYGQNDQVVEICPIAIEIAESYLQIEKIAPLPFEVKWEFPTEDVALIGHYEIFRNGVSLGTTDTTTYTEVAPVVGKYTYEIKALDASEQPLDIGSIVIEKMVSKQIELNWIFPDPEDNALRMYQYQRYYNGVASTPACMWDTTLVDTPRATGKYTYEIKALDFAETSSTIGPLTKEMEVVQEDVPLQEQALLVQAISQAQARRTSASEVLLSWIPNNAQNIKNYEVLIGDESLIVLSGNTQQYKHNIEETGHLGKCVYTLIAYDQNDRKFAPYSLEFEIAPSYLEVEKKAENLFELNWTFLGQNMDSIRSYDVYRNYLMIKQAVPKDTTTCLDTTFLAPGAYTYRVIPRGSSLQPAVKEIVVVSYLQVEKKAENVFELNWTFSEQDMDSIESYDVYRDAFFIKQSVPKDTTTCLDITFLAPGTYTYRVIPRGSSLQPAVKEITVIEEEVVPYFNARVVSEITPGVYAINLAWKFLEQNEVPIESYYIFCNDCFARPVGKEVRHLFVRAAPGDHTYEVRALDKDENIIEEKQVTVRIDD